MTKNKGDLISRSELKKAIEELAIIEEVVDYDCGVGSMTGVSQYIDRPDVLDLIDNAPTVEPFEPDYVGKERLEARQRGYEEGYRNGMAIGKTLNPKIKQSEWIDHWDKGYVECPFCHKQITGGDLNFCVKCGADMRKGGAE